MIERSGAEILNGLLDVFYPRGLTCAACGREAEVNHQGLCRDCAEGLEVFVAAPLIKGVDGYTAPLIYNDVSGAMVKGLKYYDKRYLAPVLAGLIELPEKWNIDFVVPVPLYIDRERQRGFNQSELIAKHLCKRCGLQMNNDLLRRVKDTGQLAGLTGEARRRSLKQAFSASEECMGKSLLLLDDVRTTGTTLLECAAELKRKGASKVYAATVCFAKEH